MSRACWLVVFLPTACTFQPPPVVLVTNGVGAPIENFTIDFAIDAGGVLSDKSVRTDVETRVT